MKIKIKFKLMTFEFQNKEDSLDWRVFILICHFDDRSSWMEKKIKQQRRQQQQKIQQKSGRHALDARKNTAN
jgi:hypothetical protein